MNHKEEMNTPGPPCKHMEGHLNRTADGTAGPFARWYALAHAARCGRCGRYLRALQEMVERLRQGKQADVDAEALERLAKGPWRSKSD